MPPKLIFDDEQLRAIVATSTSWHQVARKLRPDRPNGISNAAKRRVIELGIDTTHFIGRQRSLRGRWTDADLVSAVSSSLSIAGVLRMIGLVPAGGNYDQVNRRIAELGLETSHFTGQGWLKNKSIAVRPARPIEEVLVVGRLQSSHKLKQRLFKLGLKLPACERCGWAERAPDGRVPVELDHINGDRCDNRLENLRILCPSCHSLQPTHRGLNQRRAKRNRATDSRWHMMGLATHYAVRRAVPFS